MATKNSIKKKLSQRIAKISKGNIIEYVAVLGNKNGVVKADENGNVYVTDFSGMTTVAYNDKVSNDGVYRKVIVQKNKDTKEQRVIRFVNAYPFNKLPEIMSHRETHEWPHFDAPNIRQQQIQYLQAIPDETGFILNVYGGRYYLNGVRLLRNTTFDIESYIPASGANWLLIEADEDGELSVLVGDSVDSRGVLTHADIPEPSSGKYPLWAVKVYAGQSRILYNSSLDTDIISFLLMGYGTGGGDGIPGGNDTEVQYNDGGAFAGDSEFVWLETLKQLWIGGDWISGFLGKGIGIVAEGETNDVARNRLFHFGTQTSGPGITTGAAGGTRASPTANTDGKVLGQWSIVSWYGDDEDSKKTIGYIRAVATDDHATGDQPFQWEIYTCPPGSDTPTLAMTITPDGHIDIASGKEYRVNGAQHTHDAGNIATGTMATARLGSGTASASTFLAGDQTYKQPLQPDTNANDIFRCDLPGGTSAFVGTIATLPGGATLTYNVTSGNEGAMVPTSTSQLAKMRLYNTTRGTNALISNCVVGTNTLTLTANVPAGWTVGDTITIASQTVSGGGIDWVDVEITSYATGKTGMLLFTALSPNVANAFLRSHPFEAFGAAKFQSTTGQVANVVVNNMHYVKITNNVFTIGWSDSPNAIVYRLTGWTP